MTDALYQSWSQAEKRILDHFNELLQETQLGVGKIGDNIAVFPVVNAWLFSIYDGADQEQQFHSGGSSWKASARVMGDYATRNDAMLLASRLVDAMTIDSGVLDGVAKVFLQKHPSITVEEKTLANGSVGRVNRVVLDFTVAYFKVT